MGLSFGSRFSVLGHVTASQTPACTNQVHHPCHLTNSTEWVRLMAK